MQAHGLSINKYIYIKIPKQICLKPYYVSVGRCWGEGGGVASNQFCCHAMEKG
jgi:hypothetical protein